MATKRPLIENGAEPRTRQRTGADSTRLSIRLLGGFEISCGDRRVHDSAWRLSKARTLVQLLALAPGYRAHREQVLELLWPDLDMKSAAGNLYQVIHAARRALACASPSEQALGNAVLLRQNVVALSPSVNLYVDVDEFERLAHNAVITSDVVGIRAALALYQGDLLPEHPYDDWIAPRRQLLRDRYWSLLVELGEMEEKSGNYLTALDAFKQAVSFEPTREWGHAGIMRVEARRGQRAAALEQFGVLETIIRTELSDEPDSSIRQLRDDILTATSALPPTPWASGAEPLPPENLPPRMTTLVGRDREISELDYLLSRHRVVTITGPGGSGKSRMAIAVAETLLPEYPDGAWFVDLSTTSDPGLIENAIIQAMSLTPSWELDASSQLRVHVADKKMLLVLDGCEHLLARCAEVVRELLNAGPDIRILVTSREHLHVSGEAIWRIPLLDVPGTDTPATVDDLKTVESVQLFVDRARLAVPSFELTGASAPSVAQICRLLDGLPLAIELAAARVRVLSVEQIAERLAHSLRLRPEDEELSPDSLLRPLQLALNWSHALLDEHDRLVLQRSAVFSGGWSLEAAETVIPDSEVPVARILESLTHLVDKSLVTVESVPGGVRYRMLDAIRQFALDRLRASGAIDSVLQRHADYFTRLAEPADGALRGSEHARVIGQLEAEFDNLRSALGWLIHRGRTQRALRLGFLMGRFLVRSGVVVEGRKWLEQLVEMPDSRKYPYECIRALFWIGRMAYLQADYPTAEERLTECLDLAQESGDLTYVAAAHNQLGHVAFRHGDLASARSLHVKSLQTRRQIGDPWHVAMSLRSIGQVALEEGDTEAAWSYIEESITILGQTGDEPEIAESLYLLGQIALQRQKYGQARRMFENCLERARKTRYWLGMIKALNSLGLVTLIEGDLASAWHQFVQGLSILNEVGSRRDLADNFEGLASVMARRGEYDVALYYFGAAQSLRETLDEPPSTVQKPRRENILETLRQNVDDPWHSPPWLEGRVAHVEQVAAHALSLDVIER